MSIAPSSAVFTFDQENENLEQDVLALLYSAQVHGYRISDDNGLLMTGGRSANGFDIKQVRNLQLCRSPNTIRHLRSDDLHSVVRAAMQLQLTLQSSGFERFKRGFHAWESANKENFVDGRLHQFARSVEALLKPETGKTLRQFVHRCQTFIGSGQLQKEILEEIYELRSSAEHLNDHLDVLSTYPTSQQERIARLRGFQMETIANNSYSRLLAKPSLLKIFRSDSTIEDFWKLKDGDRASIWGNAIDLAAEQSRYFRFEGVP